MYHHTLFLMICLALSMSITAQTGKKPTTAPAKKPAATTPAKKPAGAIPPNIAPEKPVVAPATQTPMIPQREADVPLTKYELYGLLKKFIDSNGYNRNWLLTERLSNFYLIYKEPVAIIPQKPETEYDSEAKEKEALLKLYIPKAYELAIEFTPYNPQQTATKAYDNKEYADKLNNLKEQYRIDEIFENTENKEFFAMDNDERNRLANYLIARSFLDSSTGNTPPPTEELLIQGFSVKVQYAREYYKTIPRQAGDDARKIVQYIETTIRTAPK
ncbi:MAG TPA: hypothetical protein PK239_06130 [Chitinophagales bacterium]|nr:hypothetical protein [Chitinophagales bacterium]HRK26852.1 hypothetical protein [Chitinophagales bacterium]